MKLKIVKFYILLVLILVLTFPAFYFITPSFSDINRIKPVEYSGEYHFYNSGDVELFARFHRSENSDVVFIFLPDGPSKIDVAFEMIMLDSLMPYGSVLFPDYRGTGKSERRKSTGFYNLDNYVSDLATHVDKYKDKKIILISHGFGTLISQTYLLSKENDHVSQILISPFVDFQKSAREAAMAVAERFEIKDSEKQVPMYYEMRGYHVDEEEVGFFGTSKILALMDFYKVNFVDTNLATYIFPETILKQKVYSMDELSSTNLPSTTIGLTYELYKSDIRELFNTIPENTKIIMGKDDSMKADDFFNSKVPDKIHYIDDAGFYPYIEKPKHVLNIIRKHIDET